MAINKKILYLLFGCFLLSGSIIFSRGVIYLFTGDYDVKWANNEPSMGHYVHEIRDGLRRLGYTPIWIHDLNGLKNFDKLIFCSVLWGDERIAPRSYKKEKLIAFLWEPPTVLPDDYSLGFQSQFSRVYTWNTDLIDNVHRFQFYYPFCFPMIDGVIPFSEKKLCVMVNANKDSNNVSSLYGERRNVIKFYEKNHIEDFDFYGYGWASAGFRNYKGTVVSKVDCIKKYKFCYAYENMHNIKGCQRKVKSSGF